jgi:hypothetical protein
LEKKIMIIDVNVITPWASREDKKRIIIKPSGYGAQHKGFALLDLSACEEQGIDLRDFPHDCLPLFYAEYASAIKERLEQTDPKFLGEIPIRNTDTGDCCIRSFKARKRRERNEERENSSWEDLETKS